jgi:hypothetical protein
VRGSRSLYPPEAVDQLVAVHRLDEASGQRWTFAGMRLQLWLQGYPIPLERVKQDLRELLHLSLETLYKLVGIDPCTQLRDTLKVAERLARLAWPHLQRGDLGQFLRHRLANPSDMHAYLVTELQLLLGGMPAYGAGEDYVDLDDGTAEKSLEAIFIDAHGLERAQTDSFGSVKPWLPRNITATLIDLARQRVLSLSSMRQALEDATPTALEQARQDRETFFVHLFTLTRGFEAAFGENAFGFGVFRFIEEMVSQPDGVMLALQIVGMLVIRRTSYGENVDQVAASIRALLPILARVEALRTALEHEIPEIAAAMRPDPDPVDSATNHAPRLQAHLQRLEALAEKHKDELTQFRARHPELPLEGPNLPAPSPSSPSR